MCISDGTDRGDLVAAGSKIETGVSMGQVGKAWSGVATTYAAAIKKYRDSVTTYGQKYTDLGGKLTTAAKHYEKGEQVNADTIASKKG